MIIVNDTDKPITSDESGDLSLLICCCWSNTLVDNTLQDWLQIFSVALSSSIIRISWWCLYVLLIIFPVIFTAYNAVESLTHSNRVGITWILSSAIFCFKAVASWSANPFFCRIVEAFILIFNTNKLVKLLPWQNCNLQQCEE